MPLWFDHGTGWEKYRGARLDGPDAFLCCPGPSLALLDQDLRGPNRTVYAVNTAYPKVKPDVWIGTDRIACFERSLWREAFPKICRKVEGDTERMRHCPNVFFADVDDCDPTNIFLRRDHDVKFVWPHNTFILALHYIIWSGAKRIYFVGCDMGGEKDYHDDRVLSDDLHKSNRRLYDALTRDLMGLSRTALRHGIQFVSSTEGSPLNHFLPFITIEDAIAKCETGVPESGPLLHSRQADAA